jgi:radical SAM superfamily enzyme YgiQ (UPF0313 family)
MRIVCTYLCDFKDRKDYYLALMPYGITTIASFLEKAGHEVILANLSSYGFLKGAQITKKIKPDVVAVSIFSFNRNESFKYIKELKKNNKSLIIIAGGQHPTFLHNAILARYPEIDFIIKGEGEDAVKKLIDADFKTTSKIIQSERIKDIDSITPPSFFQGKMIGINPAEQFKYIITSRGCPANCTYCSSPAFWKKKVTFRNPKLIVEELKYIREKYGIIYFSIRDDNFSLKKNRVLEFCKILEESKLHMMWNCQARVDTIDEEMLVALKRSGLEHIQFGVESGSEKMLKLYDKKITQEKIKTAAKLVRKVGIYLSFYLMTGMSGENDDDITATKNIISSTRPHDVIISPVAYYPGTRIYSDACRTGLFDDSKWFTSTENGLYVTSKSIYNKNIREILHYSRNVLFSSFYKSQDFITHRKSNGNDCWMNYIIEADYYLKIDNLQKVTEIYNKMIKNFPDNIWGYLKLAEALMVEMPQKSQDLLKKVTELCPSFSGARFLIALINFQEGNLSEAVRNIEIAMKLNNNDPEIITLSRKIKKAM